jgi:hypothetical protein
MVNTVITEPGHVTSDKTRSQKGGQMKEPGLDNRHRDKATPKTGQIQQKRGDTLNKNLPEPVEQFRADATLETMRKVTGKTSIDDVRKAAKRLRG